MKKEDRTIRVTMFGESRHVSFDLSIQHLLHLREHNPPEDIPALVGAIGITLDDNNDAIYLEKRYRVHEFFNRFMAKSGDTLVAISHTKTEIKEIFYTVFLRHESEEEGYNFSYAGTAKNILETEEDKYRALLYFISHNEIYKRETFHSTSRFHQLVGFANAKNHKDEKYMWN